MASSDEHLAEQKNDDAEETLKFHYVKSDQFRVIHADGAYGSLAPGGDLIHLAFFSERYPIPLEVLTRLEDGEEVSRVGREGILRELDVNTIMTVETAASIAKWLQHVVDLIRSHETDGPENGDDK